MTCIVQHACTHKLHLSGPTTVSTVPLSSYDVTFRLEVQMNAMSCDKAGNEAI